MLTDDASSKNHAQITPQYHSLIIHENNAHFFKTKPMLPANLFMMDHCIEFQRWQLTKLGDAYYQLSLGELSATKPKLNWNDVAAIAYFIRDDPRGLFRKEFERIGLAASEISKCFNSGGQRESRMRVKDKVRCPICFDAKKFVDTFRLGSGHQFCKKCLHRCLGLSRFCSICKRMIRFVEGDFSYGINWSNGKLTVHCMRSGEFVCFEDLSNNADWER